MVGTWPEAFFTTSACFFFFFFLKLKLGSHRIKRGEVHARHQAQCRLMQPICEPSYKKAGNTSWRGPRRAIVTCCLAVHVCKSHKYTLAGCHMVSTSGREHFTFFQYIFPLKLNENWFGSQEMVEAIFSQMANARSCRNTVC